MFGYIYRTHNKVNGMMYVGKRKANYFLGNRYLGSGSELRKAVRQYGKENFYVELLEEVDGDRITLCEREEYCGDFFGVDVSPEYYNIERCGNRSSGMNDKNHSKKTLDKMSEDRKGEKNSNYGNKWHRTPDMHYSDQAGENNSMFGKHHSIETRSKLSERASDLMWVCNGIDKPERIHIWEYEEYASRGFHRGRK